MFTNRAGENEPVRPSVESSTPESYRTATIQLDAFGDSITYGDSLGFEFDGTGRPKKVDASYQGWPELLGRMLTLRTGTDTAVWNIGYPGDRTNEAVEDRLPELLAVHADADRALLLMGTNDSNDFEPTPSGKGCLGEACRGTYKGEVLSVIETLKDAGRETIYLGLLPPVWGASVDTLYTDPLDPIVATRNNRIREYNAVLQAELINLPGVELGPDLFSCFLSPSVNRFSLFQDALHPNTLGYTFITALWLDAISGLNEKGDAGHCDSPIFILESLNPYAHGHKQNLLDVGDTYYTDEPFQLGEIPAELSDGVWVMQANANKNNQDPDYLSFDVGSKPVTVYIAYDPAGSPPVATPASFRPVVLSGELQVSDPSIGIFSIVKSAPVSGRVQIGGNLSADSAGSEEARQAYIVIVVP